MRNCGILKAFQFAVKTQGSSSVQDRFSEVSPRVPFDDRRACSLVEVFAERFW